MLIEYGVWVTRLALAVVFGLSAWGKVADPPGTRKAVGDFGVPLRWVPVVAWALPVAEAVVAVAVLAPWTAALAAVGALLLLAVFTAAMVRLLRRGERPSCSCFGATSATPIGARSIVRNAVLTVLAATVLAGAVTHPSAPGALPTDHALGLALLAVLCGVSARVIGELGALRRRLDEQALSALGAEGLPVGAAAPEFELFDAADTKTTLAALLAPGRDLLLVFVHPGCELCAALARELPRWRDRTRDALTIVVVGNGDAVEQETWGVEQGLGDIPSLVQRGNEAALRYRVRGTPSAVLIDAEGRVAASVARGAIAVRELIRTPRTGRRSLSTDARGVDAPTRR